MRMKFEMPNGNNPELIKKAMEAFIKTLNEYDEDITITGVNLYINARTPDGSMVCGFEDSDVWLVKPYDFKPRVPIDKYSNPKMICNEDGEPLVRVFESKSEAFKKGNFVISDGLCYQNK